MKKAIAALATGVVMALTVVSCVPSTPQARIERNPEKFQALSPKHQALVQQGQITGGMPPDAVYLAWGAPSATFQGAWKNKATERWDYAGSRPVPVSGFYGMYGTEFSPYGPYGPPGRYGYSGLGYRIGPDVAYIPYHIASVWFIDQKVDSWERAQR